MRLLHVTDTFLPKVGGAEIAIDQLVRTMSATGDECAVLAQRPRGMRGEIDVPYRLDRYPNPRSSLWAGWWIERHLATLAKTWAKPDALIGHHAFPPGYACVKFARRLGVPSVVYPRGGDIYEMSRFRRKPHAWRKLTWALANASTVVCASEAMEGIVRTIIGDAAAAEGRIVRIPNGVNLDDMRGAADGSKFDADARFSAPFVLALGRLIRRKGFHLLIEAFASLPTGDWKLVIAGDGKELAALRQQAEPLGDRVLFVGLVQGADKRWLLQHCRFMAAPSLEESFGNVALEAMACGKPVVASRASGFAEIVRDGFNGRLVGVGEVPDLSRALAEMQSANLAEYGKNALDAANGFSWPVVAGRWQELLARLTRAGG